MHSPSRFWRTLFFYLGHGLAILGAGALLGAFILGIVGWTIPSQFQNQANWAILAMSLVFTAVVVMRRIGPQLVGMLAGGTLCLLVWYAQMNWYMSGQGYPDDRFFSALMFLAAPALGYAVNHRYQWARRGPVYTVHFSFS